MTLVEQLRAARALVDSPRRWWQFGGHNSGEHDCTCAGLALTQIADDAGDRERRAREFFARTVGLTSGPDIFDWNDAPERTHADVLAAFDKAIEAAEAVA